MLQWGQFLDRHRDVIVRQWRKRLQHEVSDHNAKRSSKELTMITGKTGDAFSQLPAKNQHATINTIIIENQSLWNHTA